MLPRIKGARVHAVALRAAKRRQAHKIVRRRVSDVPPVDVAVDGAHIDPQASPPAAACIYRWSRGVLACRRRALDRAGLRPHARAC
eukprot:1232074-Prymnesium_polylepis.1